MSRPLRIAIASGKGGTGKTTIATNLAVVLAESGVRTAYADCDVEEPNGHIFLGPVIQGTRDVSTPVPEVDTSRCTLCGACSKACRYSAIVALPNMVMTFPKLCHGCGGCALACPTGAIREVPRVTGCVEQGVAGQVTFVQGRLQVGEAMAPPVIRAVLQTMPDVATVVMDAPPGTSCPVIAVAQAADVVLLVTEPTPFGLNDLRLAVETVRELGVPFGVAINRAGTGERAVYEYCAQQGIPILLEIANSRLIAQAYSRGELCSNALPELRAQFLALHERLRALAQTKPLRCVPKPVVPYAEESSQGSLLSEMVRLGRKQELDELVVISGKGGTGKTSVVASFAVLAENAAMADCDVDAADLHLVLSPKVLERRSFSGGATAVIEPAACTECGLCSQHCRFGAIVAPSTETGVQYHVDGLSCEGCGVCSDICPEHAIRLVPTTNGEWFVSETRHGPLVHARLGIAQENSGKLVSLVRREAKARGQRAHRSLLICDGSPGIGCPVIASISGARMVLVVTEPTLSGLHDLERVAELCRQLGVETAVCINKVDINPEIAAAIEAEATRRSIPVLGRIRYDDSVIAAQVRQLSVVEYGGGPAAMDIVELWQHVRAAIHGSHAPAKRAAGARAPER